MAEKATRTIKFVYNPATSKWQPDSKVTGTPTYGYQQGVASTATAVLTVPAGAVFALTDIILTNTITAGVTVTVSDGSNVIFTWNVGAGASVDLQFETPLVFKTSVTVASTGATNVTVSGVTAQRR